jgi:hypothetical protein|tara:strand:- start:7549 stop:7728 length:180 start_codon:yes stop_codon:yes gene_type:complete
MQQCISEHFFTQCVFDVGWKIQIIPTKFIYTGLPTIQFFSCSHTESFANFGGRLSAHYN